MNLNNLVVNWHMLEPCQLKCSYCYAEWAKCRQPEIYRNRRKSKQLIDAIASLASNRSVRLSLAGGEPLLDKRIAEKITWACHRSLLVSVITNGSLLDRLDDLSLRRLYMLGVSIDSFNARTNLLIGRATNSGRTVDYEGVLSCIQHARRVNPHLKIKINTVVNRHNWGDDMVPFIERVRPDKWKILRVLPSTPKAKKEVITDGQYLAFKSRHQHLPYAQFEDNDDMRDSYLMLDPYGQFFSNSSGEKYTYSAPVLEVGIRRAMRQTGFDNKKFLDRYNGEVE